jgi:asparagine synthase (glutamine-hydrolysing)
MCGIAGAVFWNDERNRDAMAIGQRMTAALLHRGPDGHGVAAPRSARFDAPAVVFGHTRLAIIDLSDRAAQPMASADGLTTLTFNGEVYNFREVRKDLESRGRRFRTESDGEVVLQGYEEWGTAVVDRLRGMFAFALWDGRLEQLVLVRDRLGIKPLYLSRQPGCLLFASEIRALLASEHIPRRLDLEALDQFLAYQTVPSPRTLVQEIELLQPGVSLVCARDGVVARRYWDLLVDTPACQAPSAAGDVPEAVGALLRESAALHLVSDVPVGVFLSGGIDSTIVAALVRRAGVTPRTFAVTFPGTRFDEAVYARAAASALGAEHTELPMGEADVLSALREGLERVDHPSGDGLNTYLVAGAVRQAGMKVALSGLGGDEFFGGYPSFARLDRIVQYGRSWRQTPKALRRVAGAAVRAVGGPAKAAALIETDGSLPQTYPILRRLFAPEQRAALVAPSARSSRVHADPYVAVLDEAVARRPDWDTMALVSFAEARTYMHDLLLRDTDQMSMCHGLEVRVPLLDHRLVEYVLSLPEEYKRRGGGPKPLLTAAVEALPSVCIDRPKQGFTMPFDDWMRGALRPYAERHLGPDGLAGRECFNGEGVRAVWQDFLDGRESWSRPWTLVALNAWLERTGVRA